MLKTFSFLIVLLIAAPGADAETSYRQAVEAAASDDYQNALDHFESALMAEPNNLQYGSEYRQLVIKTKSYDRSIAFFEKLVESHPEAGNAFLNFGFAYVDWIPDAGAITQVINANTALSYFTKSIELEPTWIGYYTRGNSYLYWPKIFNRTHLGIDDLEKAIEIQSQKEKADYHVRSYIALGDGYWKMDEYDKAREVWEKGASMFPENDALSRRLSAANDELTEIVKSSYDPNLRVNTDLEEMWGSQ